MASDSTTQLQLLLDRINAGEAAARDELIGRACDRLRRLTRKIFQDFQRVRRFEDTGDVLQNSVLRLHRRLQAVSVPSVADFFYLAAREIRLELIDLARHYYGPTGEGTKRAAAGTPAEDSSCPGAVAAQADSSYDPARLALWTEFHEKVESLPIAERCIFDLLWYQGMTQEEAAHVLNISLSSVKRHWVATRLRLGAWLE